ncbi:efflux RND transporter periplasmic adaptor subunit [Polyangium sp. 15x6]|uniref:efflux RND transporter periplasmic adaptor subunit n=1 Tax=Polyangium sp. 15x6 TaxID=3042687 RepID=UPI00249C7AAB|nr:efflux RND transporter periplasmic adaptor subunit [Polyangium sp. 15x6]MDI3288321.1 efflux RND transporter periplasmic adaptor subunit [Polyangium sp. 15x6]
MSARRKSRRWPWVLVTLLVVASSLVLIGQKGKAAPAIDPALVVRAKRGTLAIDIIETGKITPRDRVEIKSRVAGQVTEVRIDAGEHVTKGQLLVQLDPTDYEREAARADADVAQAKTALDFARTNRARIEAGVTGNVIQGSELITANHEVNARSIGLKAAQVTLGIARDKIRYTKITSPMEGTVIERNIDPGEVVVPGVQSTFEGRPLLTIADLSVLLVEVDLNQIDAAKVRSGQKVTVTLDALPGETYEASITKIAPASVRRPGKDFEAFPVEARLERVDGKIKPGMTADVRIHVDAKPNVLIAPLEVIRREKGKDLLTRVITGPDNLQRTERVEVTLGARNDREVEVVSGIAEGEALLIDPGPATQNETKM